MPPTYKAPTHTQERSKIQQGIDQLEATYESLDSFVNGHTDPPPWVSLLSEFRAGLDFVKADAAVLESGGSTGST